MGKWEENVLILVVGKAQVGGRGESGINGGRELGRYHAIGLDILYVKKVALHMFVCNKYTSFLRLMSA